MSVVLPGQESEYIRRRNRVFAFSMCGAALVLVMFSVSIIIGIEAIILPVLWGVFGLSAYFVLRRGRTDRGHYAERTVEIDGTREEVNSAILEGASALAPACFVYEPVSHRAAGITPLSIWSIGEKVVVITEQIAPRRVRVTISSETLSHHGPGSARKHMRNLEAIAARIPNHPGSSDFTGV